LRPSDVYDGPRGAISQLQDLLSWFELQREFHFYSASILILYEGDAEEAENANVRVRLVDFAHTFKVGGIEDGTSSALMAPATVPADGDDEDAAAAVEMPRPSQDENFLRGLTSVISRLSSVSRFDVVSHLI